VATKGRVVGAGAVDAAGAGGAAAAGGGGAAGASGAAAAGAGLLGVAALTAGPGVTNGMSAMASAQQNGSPMLVLGGRAHTLHVGVSVTPAAEGDVRI